MLVVCYLWCCFWSVVLVCVCGLLFGLCFAVRCLSVICCGLLCDCMLLVIVFDVCGLLVVD